MTKIYWKILWICLLQTHFLFGISLADDEKEESSENEVEERSALYGSRFGQMPLEWLALMSRMGGVNRQLAANPLLQFGSLFNGQDVGHLLDSGRRNEAGNYRHTGNSRDSIIYAPDTHSRLQSPSVYSHYELNSNQGMLESLAGYPQIHRLLGGMGNLGLGSVGINPRLQNSLLQNSLLQNPLQLHLAQQMAWHPLLKRIGLNEKGLLTIPQLSFEIAPRGKDDDAVEYQYSSQDLSNDRFGNNDDNDRFGNDNNDRVRNDNDRFANENDRFGNNNDRFERYRDIHRIGQDGERTFSRRVIFE